MLGFQDTENWHTKQPSQFVMHLYVTLFKIRIISSWHALHKLARQKQDYESRKKVAEHLRLQQEEGERRRDPGLPTGSRRNNCFTKQVRPNIDNTSCYTGKDRYGQITGTASHTDPSKAKYLFVGSWSFDHILMTSEHEAAVKDN